MSATGFSIMELLGGQLGVTHTPSRADAGRLSARVPPLATVEPTPGHGTTIGTRQWCHDGAGQGRVGGSGSPGLTPVRGSGDVGTHREGRRQGHGDKEEREPNWELLPLLGDTVAAGNNPQQHLRPGQANLWLRVAQKWYLWSTLNPKSFYALLQGKGA